MLLNEKKSQLEYRFYGPSFSEQKLVLVAGLIACCGNI